MRTFNYVALKNQKWDSEIVAYIAAIHEMKGKQDLYIRQKPQELEKLVEIAKVQSTETSNEIEGIRTTNTRLKQLLSEKTTPRTRDEEEIAGYRDVLNVMNIFPLPPTISCSCIKSFTVIRVKVSAVSLRTCRTISAA